MILSNNNYNFATVEEEQEDLFDIFASWENIPLEAARAVIASTKRQQRREKDMRLAMAPRNNDFEN